MRRVLTVLLSLLLVSSSALAIQNGNSNANSNTRSSSKKKRGPVFRASKDQIKQAQTVLKQRGFYQGETTGKLDSDTREGLKRYQQAESIKVTGTLNRLTMEKMNIQLTDKQKMM